MVWSLNFILGLITSRCSGNESTLSSKRIFSGRKPGPEGAAEIEPKLILDGGMSWTDNKRILQSHRNKRLTVLTIKEVEGGKLVP